MGLLSPELEEKRLRLARMAQRRAFDCYLRFGQVPLALERLAEATKSEAQFLEFGSTLFGKSLREGRPTTHYVWRTARDDRVRSTHAALSGKIFSWSDGPAHGHPGSEPNCRCWAEPYYGHPNVPDRLLEMARSRRSDATGAAWSVIESATRPDGSIAESTVILRDGTRIHSALAGTSLTHTILLSDGSRVVLDKLDSVRRVFVGEQSSPQLEMTFSASGPQLSAPRIRVAQGGVLRLLVPPIPATGQRRPAPSPVPDELVGRTLLATTPAATAILGALRLFSAVTAERPAFGVGTTDVPVLAFRAWSNSADQGAVSVEALTPEQVSQWCKRLPEVQELTNAAAADLLPLRESLGPSLWGTAVHARLHSAIQGLRLRFPIAYHNVYPELSIDAGEADGRTSSGPRYGQPGSTRLDILEDVGPELICVYDIKTGSSGLTPSRVRVIADRVSSRYPGASFYILEVRPFE